MWRSHARGWWECRIRLAWRTDHRSSFADIALLLEVIGRLKGNSIVIIEHNLDVIKTTDYIVALGSEGGDGERGRIIALGSPEEVAKDKES